MLALLQQLAGAEVISSPVAAARSDHLATLLSQCDSQLGRRWLEFLQQHQLRLPDKAQHYMGSCQTRPDFLYEDQYAIIYVDGPPHDHPDRQTRDQAQQSCLDDLGYEVIRSHHEDDWLDLVRRYGHVFGEPGSALSVACVGMIPDGQSLDRWSTEDVVHELPDEFREWVDAEVA